MKFPFEKLLAIPIIFIGILNLLDFFFKDYNDHNKYEIDLIYYIIIFSVVLIVVSLYVLYLSQDTDKFIKIARSFAFGVLFGLASVLFVGMVKDQTAFHLNKLYTKKNIEDHFEITHRAVAEKDSLVGLISVNNSHWFSTKNKFTYRNLIRIQKTDTIKLKYGIGLLNKPFLPYGKLEILE